MRKSSTLCAVGFIVLSGACSSSNGAASGSGAASSVGAASSAGGASNIGGNGGSGNGINNGGGGGIDSTAGGIFSNVGGDGPTFCVIGSRGCACDVSATCGSGLVCTNNTCCDSVTGSCSLPPLPPGVGGSGPTGTGGSSTATTGTGGKGSKGATGGAGTFTCVPGVTGPVVADCGYPYTSNNPLTSVAFNESSVLVSIVPSGGTPLASVRVYYGDEHALTLGVRSVVVKTSTGTTTTDYPVTPLATDPATAHAPQTGTNQLTGNQSGLDPSGRPMWPVLYVTDITNDTNSRVGDWQMGGTPYNPNAIFGTWKAAVSNVDETVTPALADTTPDVDPAKNNWKLGGGDPVPTTLAANEGYGTEVRWDLVLIPGHSYRMQVMVHDGDQNKVGGDSGEACVDFCAEAACPEGSPACGAAGQATCPQGAECWNGCCLMQG